ncbi:MAG: cation transporter [Flavobacterium sp.]|jgi:mercuric ion binding protein|nr:cation transporter [Flavobacterium sp.]
MNKSKLVIALMLFFAMFTNVNAQSKNTKTETFKVWGNCGMCEKIIEKSLKTKGISSAEWNKDTKMITVVFNPKKISLSAIHKKIASVGYDTELETASDEVYNNLHGCCQYERKNN